MTMRHRRTLPIRLGALLLIILALAPAAGHAQAAHPARIPGAAPTPPFAGPVAGAPLVAAPRGTDFAYHCNAGPSQDGAHAAGAALAAGAAIQGTACGQALLFLDAPASGHFRATFAVADSAPAGSMGALRLFVQGPGGATLRALDVSATRGQARPVDIDVAGATTLALTFLPAANAADYVYKMQLTGAARARRATPMPGTGFPAGATPAPARTLTFPCNAGAATQPTTVSALTVPMTGTYTTTGCGTIVIQLPPQARGALALRFGIADISLTAPSPHSSACACSMPPTTCCARRWAWSIWVGACRRSGSTWRAAASPGSPSTPSAGARTSP